MRDFSLLAAQIRAARGLLGWSQAYLAEGIAVNRSTIVNWQSGKSNADEATLPVLMSELTIGGIVFTEKGVEFQNWPSRLKPIDTCGAQSANQAGYAKSGCK